MPINLATNGTFRFNPLDRGNLYQIFLGADLESIAHQLSCFNPLDRGNLYQMESCFLQASGGYSCFNPLDRGNLYQIIEAIGTKEVKEFKFQSPRSGKFVSDRRAKFY